MDKATSHADDEGSLIRALDVARAALVEVGADRVELVTTTDNGRVMIR